MNNFQQPSMSRLTDKRKPKEKKIFKKDVKNNPVDDDILNQNAKLKKRDYQKRNVKNQPDLNNRLEILYEKIKKMKTEEKKSKRKRFSKK